MRKLKNLPLWRFFYICEMALDPEGICNMKILVIVLLLFHFTTLKAEYLAEWSQSEFLEKSRQENVVIVDVRSKREFIAGHIAGAINIPYDEIQHHFNRFTKDRSIVLYCQSGRRAGIAEKVLFENGFKNLFHLKGDFGAWKDNGLPIHY